MKIKILILRLMNPSYNNNGVEAEQTESDNETIINVPTEEDKMKFKIEYEEHYKRKKAYEENKMKAVALIMSNYCNVAMKH